MAGIDKIYGTNSQYWEFYNWAKDTVGVDYFYEFSDFDEHNNCRRPITNTPVWFDVQLWKICPLEFVKNELVKMYGQYGKPVITKSEVYFMKSKHHYKEQCWNIYEMGFKYFVKPNTKNIWVIEKDYPNIYVEKTLLTIDDLLEL